MNRSPQLRWIVVLLAALSSASAMTQPLPSWNDGPAKQAIVTFVSDVTTPGTPTFVASEDRIAVFHNDGTLWAEQPLYFQFLFMLEQVRAAAPKHPEWNNDPAFKALMAHDSNALAAMGRSRS